MEQLAIKLQQVLLHFLEPLVHTDAFKNEKTLNEIHRVYRMVKMFRECSKQILENLNIANFSIILNHILFCKSNERCNISDEILHELYDFLKDYTVDKYVDGKLLIEDLVGVCHNFDKMFHTLVNNPVNTITMPYHGREQEQQLYMLCDIVLGKYDDNNGRFLHRTKNILFCYKLIIDLENVYYDKNKFNYNPIQEFIDQSRTDESNSTITDFDYNNINKYPHINSFCDWLNENHIINKFIKYLHSAIKSNKNISVNPILLKCLIDLEKIQTLIDN